MQFGYTFMRIEKDAVLTPFNFSDVTQQSDMRGHRMQIFLCGRTAGRVHDNGYRRPASQRSAGRIWHNSTGVNKSCNDTTAIRYGVEILGLRPPQRCTLFVSMAGES
jgi:hypothetical protein